MAELFSAAARIFLYESRNATTLARARTLKISPFVKSRNSYIRPLISATDIFRFAYCLYKAATDAFILCILCFRIILRVNG